MREFGLIRTNTQLYSIGFEPGSDSRSFSVIVRVRAALKRTVVDESD